MRILRWYTMIYWLDCVVSLISTIWFAVTWFVYTDHSLPELADDPEKLAEHDRVFKMESQVSILVLVILRLIHVSVAKCFKTQYRMLDANASSLPLQFYFAFVVTRYYKNIASKPNYSKVSTNENAIDLEDIVANANINTPATIVGPKPAQD